MSISVAHTKTISDDNFVAPLIDVIMSNKSSNISINNVIPLSLSDHDCIVCVRKINHKKNTTTRNNLPKLQTLRSYYF